MPVAAKLPRDSVQASEHRAAGEKAIWWRTSLAEQHSAVLRDNQHDIITFLFFKYIYIYICMYVCVYIIYLYICIYFIYIYKSISHNHNTDRKDPNLSPLAPSWASAPQRAAAKPPRRWRCCRRPPGSRGSPDRFDGEW